MGKSDTTADCIESRKVIVLTNNLIYLLEFSGASRLEIVQLCSDWCGVPSDESQSYPHRYPSLKFRMLIDLQSYRPPRVSSAGTRDTDPPLPAHPLAAP